MFRLYHSFPNAGTEYGPKWALTAASACEERREHNATRGVFLLQVGHRWQHRFFGRTVGGQHWARDGGEG